MKQVAYNLTFDMKTDICRPFWKYNVYPNWRGMYRNENQYSIINKLPYTFVHRYYMTT